MNRQIVLDTETTGLEVEQGHRVIEIGCVELRNRRCTGNDFHRYINPRRVIDAQAVAVHGITNERLAGEPEFAALAQDLWRYLEGAELVIHNAAFDLGFLDSEFARAGLSRKLAEVCGVVDTVALARRLHPGQRASLDALCRRYNIDNSGRGFHGALLDARLLADVYLAMTGGQALLFPERGENADTRRMRLDERMLPVADAGGGRLKVVRASDEELAAHRKRLEAIAAKAGRCLWQDELPG